MAHSPGKGAIAPIQWPLSPIHLTSGSGSVEGKGPLPRTLAVISAASFCIGPLCLMTHSSGVRFTSSWCRVDGAVTAMAFGGMPWPVHPAHVPKAAQSALQEVTHIVCQAVGTQVVQPQLWSCYRPIGWGWLPRVIVHAPACIFQLQCIALHRSLSCKTKAQPISFAVAWFLTWVVPIS
jgi:hypothetical protein